MRLSYPRMLIVGIISVGIVIGAIYTINLTNHYRNTPITVIETTDDFTVEFSVSNSTILNDGDCVTFSWNADRIAGIYFDGQGRIAPDSVERCPDFKDLPETYEVEVDHVDGAQSVYIITLNRAIPRFVTLPIFIFVVLLGLLLTFFIMQRDEKWFVVDSYKARSTRLRNAAYILILLTPITVIVILLWFFHGATLAEIMPHNNDDAYYWHQSASFIRAGFNSGYYTTDEIPARAEFSSFYAWGAGIPILYGSIGAVFGWSLQAIPIINLVLLTSTIAIYLAVVRPNLRQTLLLWLLIASFTYMYVFSVRSMLPLLLQTSALMTATFFVVLFIKKQESPLWIKIALAGSIASAVAIRPTFGVLWLPYLLLVFPRISLIISTIGSVILLGMGVWLQSWWSAYHPFHTTLVMQDIADGNIAMAFNRAWSLAINNLYYILNFNIFPVNLAYRTSILVVLIISITVIVLKLKQNKWQLTTNDEQFRTSLFAIYTLLIPYALITVAFALGATEFVSNEIRYISPFFLLVMAVLIGIGQHRYIRMAIVPLLFILPITINQFQYMSNLALNPDTTTRYESLAADLEPMLQWDASATNRWCNTVLLENPEYIHDIPFMLAIDTGLGFSWIGENDLPSVERFRSAYVVLTDETAMLVLPGKNLEPIADVPNGKVYRNWDSDCDIELDN